MKNLLYKGPLVFALLFSGACSSTSSTVEPPKIASIASSPVHESDLVWESTPRVLGPGSGAQLWVRASESINMIHAMPGEKGSNLYYKNSHNEGHSFEHAKIINKVPGEVSAHGENNPQLRMGPGIGIYALWEGERQLKFSRSMNFGRSFLPPVQVNDDKGPSSHSFFTMETSARGEIYAAWLDGRDKATEPPGHSSIYLARSIDQGATFGKNIKVSGNICPCCRPALAIDPNGTLYLAWRHILKGDERVIVVASSSDSGKTWSAPVPVTKKGWVINGCAHSGPAMKWIKGKLILTWYTAAENKARLLMTTSNDGGKTFSSPRSIHGPVLDPNHPHMAEVGGEAWIIFQGRYPDKQDGWGAAIPWVTRVTAEGKTTKPQALPAGENGIAYPQLFPGNGGRLYAVWIEFGKKGPQMMLSRGRLKPGS
ncbi:MAG: exo-alpha-sialidase [Candidatus Nitronauta litoralis]|uniref:Exo-alpha-sialidase n=1 Tax=Candidatus Nitronauta litoralis TaxID=2705533 RepID=A0A7T0BTE7_9BACT|nr:MAG: exo-alpha-sialidase [Candidatus Nitronauta litoralis]